MLEDEEADSAQRLYSRAFRSGTGSIEDRFKPLLDYYELVTGWKETNPDAVIHHFERLYGPPCEHCGKPYRTKLASSCAACGNRRDREE